MPKELPAAVIKTLDRLRLEYGGNLSVSIIAGNFCVYDHGSTFDKEIGRKVRRDIRRKAEPLEVERQ